MKSPRTQPAKYRTRTPRRPAAARPGFEPLEARQLMTGEGGDPEPIIPDPLEPNQTFLTATNFGATFTASPTLLSLHVTGTTVDVDYFKFTAPTDGVAIAQIDFLHLDGNLKLTAYNGAQQQIAFSDSSTIANGREVVSINAAAGQTYYLKVNGGSIHEYSLDLRPISAAFDWSMPRRTGAQLDAFGKPVFPNTRDYARPNPTFINGIETPRYGVALSALSAVAGDGVTYQWAISNSLYSTTASGAAPVVDLPQGQFNVTLSATLGGSTVTSSQTINVKDVLLVALGDSYGSGESNPHSPVQYDFFGYPTRGAVWASSPDAQEAFYHRLAHRSSAAAVAQAAINLENADPKSSVTFVFLDHTGATIDVGLLGAQPSGEYGVPGNTPPQVDRMAQIVGNRKIDQLVLSIGGNDLGFGPVLAALVQADPLFSGGNYHAEVQNILNTALDNITNLGNVGYPALAQRLSQFDIGQTFLVEYPDLARDGTGGFAEKILDDIAPFFEVDRNELTLASAALVEPFQNTMREACRKFGWSYLDGVDEQYATHGYGDWLRTAQDSARNQGPCGNIVSGPSLGDLQNTNGTMHPIGGGLTAQRAVIENNLAKSNLVTTAFTISPQAFQGGGANSTFSLTVQNTSFKSSAPASTARVLISFDSNVTLTDIGVADVAIPALAPGQSVTVNGTLPHYSDPFLNPGNVMYCGPVVDVNSNVDENNEVDNVVANLGMIRSVQSERDLTAGSGALTLVGTPVGTNSSTSAWLGLDEVIGDRDMDAYRFTVAAGQRLAFDVDSPGSFDTYVRLFPVVNNVIVNPLAPLAANDNGAAPGETGGNANESYLRYTFGQGGEYALVVSHEYNRFSNPMRVDGRSHAWEGAYTLNISQLESVAPTVQASGFDVDANRLSYRFSEDVGGSIGNGTVALTNLATGQTIPVAAQYDTLTNTASFRFTGFAGGLPAGNYRATIAKANVFDPSGNTLADDVVLNFFAMPGDANRDRAVNIGDFSILASRFNAGGTFSQGDFNYSGTVEIGDFAILASAFNTTLPAARPGAPEPSTPPASASRALFGDARVESLMDALAV